MLIPATILPETWKSAERPDAVGTIRAIRVQPSFVEVDRPQSKSGASTDRREGAMIENVVLTIQQSRAGQQRIGTLIRSLLESQSVDPEATRPIQIGGTSNSIGFGGGLIPAEAP